MATTLADALDDLYGGTPAAFTASRASWVRRLREAGNERDAGDLSRRKRPTQGAWLLNQLARRDPDDVQTLADLGRTLVRAQRGTLRTGDAGALRDAVKKQRELIASLAKKADAIASGSE